MLWSGVPEIVVTRWYTSRTCPRHGHIAETHHRQGEHLHLPCCQRTVHADEHDADRAQMRSQRKRRNDTWH
ncbi:zinc ribbon domain-containing protein [Ectothiorhodospira haloalkaliphila]|uniref:zinc ribbon domain-containing protein n=1 Tax=Ectothiorhodospira haloalkaliphila TaxID=421628 RepID=UPI003B75CB49